MAGREKSARARVCVCVCVYARMWGDACTCTRVDVCARNSSVFTLPVLLCISRVLESMAALALRGSWIEDGIPKLDLV